MEELIEKLLSGGPRYEGEDGILAVEAKPLEEWFAKPSGVFLPEPYRTTAEMSFVTRYSIREYVDLLRAETRHARSVAAAIAGSLGGLAIALFQVLKALADLASG